MTRVLMVCLGNICRSPLAEGVLQAVADDLLGQGRVIVESAGTAGWHIGKAPDPRGQKAALARGIDICHQRARQFRRQDFDAFDYIFVMDRSNLRDVLALAPEGGSSKVSLFLSHAPAWGEDVPDPYYGGDDGFDHVLDMIEEAAHHFVLTLKK